MERNRKQAFKFLSLVWILILSMLVGCDNNGMDFYKDDNIESSDVIDNIPDIPENNEDKIPINQGEENQHIKVSFVGDCTLAEDISWKGKPEGFISVVGDDMNYCFENVKSIFENDDMTLINLECALTDSTNYRKDKQFVFASPTHNVQMLINASVEAVNLANNHTRDCDFAGLDDTVNTLTDADIKWSYGENVSVYEVKDIKIGMLGFDAITYGYNSDMPQKAINKLNELGCNIIIASCHWGEEHKYTAIPQQTELGHKLIDMGVDIVVGHHAHRLQPIEKYNGKYIMYGLSNFVFGGNYSTTDADTAVIMCDFVLDESRSKCVNYSLDVVPFSQTTSSPRNDYKVSQYKVGSEGYNRILKKLNWFGLDE